MTPSDPSNELKRMASSITTTRIETLADGVFAIVLTLLAFDLDLRVPSQDVVNQIGLAGALANLAPNFIAYLVTFVILGVLWVGHHNQFFYIKRADRTLLWINLLFMMCVALLPFSAGLLSRYGQDRVSVIIYNINLILAGLVLYVHWWYATRDSHLLNHPIDEKIRKIVNRRILTPPAWYLVAILASLIFIQASIAIDVFVPILYILPSGIDHFLHHG